jgi:predicted DNA-binding transcriptional regulator AlpA
MVLPVSGDIGRGDTDGSPGVYHEEIVEVRFPRAETVEAWAERMNRSGRHLCQCGCGAELVILPRHRSMGLPRYVHGHHSNPLRRGFDAVRRKGYKLVGDVAKLLGVSENTVRRMEAEGTIPKARRITYARGKEARVYTDSQVKAIVRSKVRERWRRAHPGRWRRPPQHRQR